MTWPLKTKDSRVNVLWSEHDSSIESMTDGIQQSYEDGEGVRWSACLNKEYCIIKNTGPFLKETTIRNVNYKQLIGCAGLILDYGTDVISWLRAIFLSASIKYDHVTHKPISPANIVF